MVDAFIDGFVAGFGQCLAAVTLPIFEDEFPGHLVHNQIRYPIVTEPEGRTLNLIFSFPVALTNVTAS
jgi:hypothetical protein